MNTGETYVTEADDIRSRLTKSDAIISLRAEQEIVAAFRSLRWWSVQHGAYFRDGNTGKLREIDVRASRSWSKGEPDSLSAHLEVLVEVKTMRGFHLVFAPHPNQSRTTAAQRSWCGYLSRERIAAALLEHGVDHDSVDLLTACFRELSYPDEKSVVADLMVDPPPGTALTTAFRETNVKADKELDASVFWKAVQGLTSIVESIRTREETAFFDDLNGAIDLARLDSLDLSDTVARQMGRRVRHVTLFHPTVVTDARLWVSNEDGLREVDHVRFLVRETASWPAPWFDVVTHRSFKPWIDSLTSHYSSQLEHPDRSDWQEDDGVFPELLRALSSPDTEVELTIRKSEQPAKRILWRSEPRRVETGLAPLGRDEDV